MINVYVVWSYDGPIMTTLLQYDDDDMTRQAMQQWSLEDWVNQAADMEEIEREVGDSYEVAAIFTCDNMNFIY